MFWYTKTTVLKLFGTDYIAWDLFGPIHLFWLAFTAALTSIIFKYYPKLDSKNKRKLLITLTVLMIIDELFKDIPSLLTNQFEWENLPFHLCSVNIFIVILNTVKESDFTKAILTCVCIPAALCALVMPNWTPLPFFNYMHLHSETIHILLFIYPMTILADGYRPNYKTLPELYAYIICLALFDKAINSVLGTNFLFLTNNENNPALILLEHLTGRLYNLGIILFLLIVCTLIALLWKCLPAKRVC